MNKQHCRSLVKWAVLVGLCLFVFFSCSSTPTEGIQGEGAQSVQEATGKTAKSEHVVQEPEVFTTVNFAQRLQKALDEGTIEDALALFQELPPEYEDDMDMQLIYASLLVSAGKLDEASDVTNKLLASHPENSDVMMLSVMLAKASGDSATKNAKIKELLKTDPTNSDANVALAEDQMLRRNYKLAGQYYSKGLEGDPNHIDALSGYGQATYYTGDDRASRSAFNKILELDPDNSIAYSFLGKLDAVDENYYSATKNIEKAIAIDDDIFDYWLDYGQYLRYQGKFQEAENAWIKAKDLRPDYFLGYAYLAGLYDEQNRLDESLAMYRKVVQYNPKYYFAYESIGMLAWHEKNYA
ncbi:MAG: tetratricopeptide repeat protein, partial [Spirochaetaceae bacterium]|nr:tetratricopeptide repeat protein [Spirochaetaceae bacterium]